MDVRPPSPDVLTAEEDPLSSPLRFPNSPDGDARLCSDEVIADISCDSVDCAEPATLPAA